MEGLTWTWRLLISAVLITTSCQKEDPFLPAKSRDGRNTFGFQTQNGFDGGEFGTWTDEFTFDTDSVYIRYDSRYGGFYSKHKDFTTIDIWLGYNNLTEKYELVDALMVKGQKGSFDYLGTEFTLDTTETNFVEITYEDYDKGILSGLFELNFAIYVEYLDEDSTLHTDIFSKQKLFNGRFDLQTLE